MLKVEVERLVKQYTEAGFTLFPLQTTGDDPKAPKDKRWRETPYNPDVEKKDLPGAFGVLLQPDDLVIDVDCRRFSEPGIDQLAELWQELGLKAVDTLIVNTASGGYHVYFKKPPELKLKSNKQIIKEGYGAIELKSFKKYAVAAGSKILDQETQGWKRYTVRRGSPLYIADCPEPFLRWAEASVDADIKQVGVESDSIGTRQRFVSYCMQAPPAIAMAQGNSQTLYIATKGKDFGLPEERTYQLMLDYYNPRCQPEWEESKLREIVRNAYLYTENAQGCDHPAADFIDIPKSVKEELKQAAEERDTIIKFDMSRKQDGTPKYDNTIGNVFNFFMLDELIGLPGRPNPLKGLVRFNTFSQEVQFTRMAPWHQKGVAPLVWSDDDTLHLKLLLNQICHFTPSTETLSEGVRVAAYKQRIHPIKDYLYSLSWDGIARLDTWLSVYLGCDDTPYVREVGKNTLLAAVDRVLNPGCKHDSVLVIEGEQGTGKSQALEILGGEYYLDPHLDLANMKDATSVLEGGWIVEISEMDFVRKSDYATLRAFISRKTDKVRPAYARTHKHFPRQCIFIGTFNPEPYMGYLTDPTGNRRFWPVTSKQIDLDGLRANRDQLFAEALYRVLAGEQHYIVDADLITAAKKEQTSRMAEDAFQETIERWIADKKKRLGAAYSSFTTDDVLIGALGCAGSQITNAIRGRVSRVLTGLGYKQLRPYDNFTGTRKRVWVNSAVLSDI